MNDEVKVEMYSKAENELIPVTCICTARKTEEADRTYKGCKDRHTHNPCRNLTFSLGKCISTTLALLYETTSEDGNTNYEYKEYNIIK